jgi:6-pyruvoyltetrahydropterin/6-carboxytetrahydropterin synthase
MRVRLTQEFMLESAHSLPRVPEEHRCRRVHGHTFVVEVTVEGEVEERSGWLVDYVDLATAFVPVREALDHRLLNEVPGLDNPTSEHVARWIWERLLPALPALAEIVVHETPVSRCAYRGE